VLLQTTCPVCGTPGPAPCDACAAELHPAPSLPAPPGVDECMALLSYDGPGRELVARLKYRNHRAALDGLAAAMATMVDPRRVDVLTWAPTSAARRRQRGFDHAELLARAVARCLRRPCRRLLIRLPGPPQTGRTAAERRSGPSFVAAIGRTPASVLVVDDVATTGATATAAAIALRAAGTTTVSVLLAARTPLKPVSRTSDH
jgi:predicted amidophosphoribosyltransferase